MHVRICSFASAPAVTDKQSAGHERRLEQRRTGDDHDRFQQAGRPDASFEADDEDPRCEDPPDEPFRMQ